MSPILLYLLKSSLSLLVLFVAYVISSRRGSYFQFNRFFLTGSLLLASLLPLFSFHFNQLPYSLPLLGEDIIITGQRLQFNLEEVVISASAGAYSSLYTLSPLYIAALIYVLGVCIKSAHLAFKFFQLYAIKRRSKVVSHGHFQFVFTQAGAPTFSFYKWIFIDPNLYKNQEEALHIIEHEKVHLQQWHSFDLLVAELICIIQWFNPIAYMFSKYIKENHEFIADENVVAHYEDESAYRLLLMAHATDIKTHSLTHNFSYSLLKRRLQMIKKPKSPLGLSAGLLGLILAINLVFFACSEPNTDMLEHNESSPSNETVYTVVELMPQYPGGTDSLINYLVNNITYPQQAKDAGIEGRVLVSFVVEKDGAINDVEVKRGFEGSCDAEAKRVVETMPNWNPGQQRGEPVRVSFVLPISFKLGEEKDNSEVFKVVKDMPEFPGGQQAMMRFLGENIKYPETAKKEGIQGRVFISFVIEKDGRVSSIEKLRGIGGGCDEEALRVVAAMPNWKPGYTDGKPVRVAYNLPIKFSLK